VIVAVKPDIVGAVLEELDLSPEQTLVSIAAGVSTDYVEARTDANVVRSCRTSRPKREIWPLP